MAKKLLTTGRGVLVYPHLTKPDTKFNKDGAYTAKLRMTGSEALALVAQIDAAIKECGAAAKSNAEFKGKTIKRADSPYKKNEDGSVEFSFKMNATGKNRKGEVFTRRPVIFNAAGQPVEGLKIGGGTVARISYELNQYTRPSTETKNTILAGANLRLEAVQVIELVEWGANPDYYGFQNEASEEQGETAAPTSEAADEAPAPAAQSGDDF